MSAIHTTYNDIKQLHTVIEPHVHVVRVYTVHADLNLPSVCRTCMLRVAD